MEEPLEERDEQVHREEHDEEGKRSRRDLRLPQSRHEQPDCRQEHDELHTYADREPRNGKPPMGASRRGFPGGVGSGHGWLQRRGHGFWTFHEFFIRSSSQVIAASRPTGGGQLRIVSCRGGERSDLVRILRTSRKSAAALTVHASGSPGFSRASIRLRASAR